ncbi:MAG: DUF3892 domain-containing protein [Peptococcaceae bacterium]|nr:DUF3892 domain-containing protein [Peptococcaceae bacterium]
MADYYICAVHYENANNERYISKVKITFNLTTEINTAYEKTKFEVVSDIESLKKKVKTKYKSNNTWHEGEDVRVVNGDSGYKYLRTDSNNIKKDNLGNLPEY